MWCVFVVFGGDVDFVCNWGLFGLFFGYVDGDGFFFVLGVIGWCGLGCDCLFC